MKCYLEELSDEDKVKSRDPKESYKKDFSETFTYAHRCSDRAIKYLEEHSNQDFFLTVSYDEPHGPSLCPEPFNYMYDGFKFDAVRTLRMICHRNHLGRDFGRKKSACYRGRN